MNRNSAAIAQSMQPIVETRDLTKHYKMGSAVVRALDGLTMHIAKGEFLGLLGASGSGKSTLLNLIAGLDRPTGGTLAVHGRNLAELSRDELSRHRRSAVGMIFQSFNLIPTMTAQENVTLAMTFAGVPRSERRTKAAGLLGAVGLADRLQHRPSELSGGEQQRVAIARALANAPDILLADEPTGNLDSTTSEEVVALLAALHAREGKTIVLVTHDRELAARHVTRSLAMRDGKILGEDGP